MREYKFRGYSKRELTIPTQWIYDGYGGVIAAILGVFDK